MAPGCKESGSQSSNQEPRSPLTENSEEASRQDVAGNPCHTKMKTIGKVVLDNCPVLINICFSFVTGTFGIYFLCWCTVITAIIALVVDFFHCRHRWAAGLDAVFPKMITVTYFLMNVIILTLMYLGMLEVDIVSEISGCFVTGGLFLASVFSLLIRRPWIYGIALESMSPEKLQEATSTPQRMKVFTEIMNSITWLWTANFLLMFCVNLLCTIWKMHGGSQSAIMLTGTLTSVFVVVLSVKFLQPKLIEAAKTKAIARQSDPSPESV